MTGRAGRGKRASYHDGRRSSEGHDIVHEVLMKERIKTVSTSRAVILPTYVRLTVGGRSVHAKGQIRGVKKSQNHYHCKGRDG